MHHQKDTGHDLDHQHEHGQRTEDVPEVEILGSVILRHVDPVGLKCRWQPVFKPVRQFFASAGVWGNFVKFSHFFSLGFLVFANEQLCLREIHMGWNFKVVRRWLVLENPTREVKSRAMARAEKPSLPVIRQ